MTRSRGLHTQGSREGVGINCEVMRAAAEDVSSAGYSELPPCTAMVAGRNGAAASSRRLMCQGKPRATAHESRSAARQTKVVTRRDVPGTKRHVDLAL